MWTFFILCFWALLFLCWFLAVSWLREWREGNAAMAEGPGKGITYIGYSPWTFTTPEGRQGLVQIFVNPDGTIESVQIAYRDWSWDSWGVPTNAERA